MYTMVPRNNKSGLSCRFFSWIQGTFPVVVCLCLGNQRYIYMCVLLMHAQAFLSKKRSKGGSSPWPGRRQCEALPTTGLWGENVDRLPSPVEEGNRYINQRVVRKGLPSCLRAESEHAHHPLTKSLHFYSAHGSLTPPPLSPQSCEPSTRATRLTATSRQPQPLLTVSWPAVGNRAQTHTPTATRYASQSPYIYTVNINSTEPLARVLNMYVCGKTKMRYPPCHRPTIYRSQECPINRHSSK